MEHSIGVYHKIFPTIGPSDDLYIVGKEVIMYDNTKRVSYFNGSCFGTRMLARVYKREKGIQVLKSLCSRPRQYGIFKNAFIEKLLPMSG
jgi:hypothetical protein